MHATQDQNRQETRIIRQIESMLGIRLGQYAAAIQVSLENTVIVLRGELPSADLREQLVPAIRQAGVLSQVSNCVQVSG